ncbi:MAG: diacylglycerol kinase family protein [Pyrinomonadaceae bacterium]
MNPTSAGGATRGAWARMASDLRTHFGAFTVEFTEAQGDARRIAAAAAARGAKLIIACGGDGTISEVTNGILESNQEVELGILPSGTGGDFRRTLKIPANTAAAARVLRDGQPRLIDVGRVSFVNDLAEHETRFFLNVASFGLSTDVLKRAGTADTGKWASALGSNHIRGKLSYAMSTFSATLSASAKEVYIRIDDGIERRLKIAELCVANARYYGGAMKIAPNAKLDDGLFDIVTIGDLGAFKILTSAPRLYLGAHLRMDQVAHALGKRIVARAGETEAEIAIELDGEIIGQLPATFQVVPRALRIRCPRP